MHGGIEVKRLDVWSLFKIGFAIYAILGLVVALIYAGLLLLAGSLGSAWFANEDLPSLGFGLAGGLLSVIIIPMLAFFYGAIAAVFVAIAGAIYNVSAHVVGGIRLDIRTFGPAFTAPAAVLAPAIPATGAAAANVPSGATGVPSSTADAPPDATDVPPDRTE